MTAHDRPVTAPSPPIDVLGGDGDQQRGADKMNDRVRRKERRRVAANYTNGAIPSTGPLQIKHLRSAKCKKWCRNGSRSEAKTQSRRVQPRIIQNNIRAARPVGLHGLHGWGLTTEKRGDSEKNFKPRNTRNAR